MPVLKAKQQLEQAGYISVLTPYIIPFHIHSGRSTHTKDGIPPGCVTAEGKDVGVVGSDHGESVRLSGQLCGSLDGFVEHHRFRQSQFGYAIVVAMIYSPSYRRKKTKASLFQILSNCTSCGMLPEMKIPLL